MPATATIKPVAEKLNPAWEAAVRRMLHAAPRPKVPLRNGARKRPRNGTGVTRDGPGAGLLAASKCRKASKTLLVLVQASEAHGHP